MRGLVALVLTFRALEPKPLYPALVLCGETKGAKALMEKLSDSHKTETHRLGSLLMRGDEQGLAVRGELDRMMQLILN